MRSLRHSRSRLFSAARRAWPLVCLGVCLAAALARAQLDGSAEFSTQTYGTDDGLPQRAVVALLPGSSGHLWIGTYGGLVRFDGERFTAYTAADTPGFEDSSATALCEDDAGALWIGHESGGLTRRVGGVFEVVRPGSALTGSVKALQVDARGELWELTDRLGLRRVRDGLTFGMLPGADTPPTIPMTITSDGSRTLWVTQNGAAARVVGESLVRWPPRDGASHFLCLGPSREGGLWMWTDAGLWLTRGEEWLPGGDERPWGEDTVSLLRDTRVAGLIAGTMHQGLYFRSASGDWAGINRTNGLPDNWVRALTEDREGNVWVGTSGGLTVLRPRKVMPRNPPDGWQGKPVMPVLSRRNGEIWAGTEGAGLYRLRQGQWRHFGAEQGLSNPFVWTLLDDHLNRLWVGTWGGGIFRLEDERLVRVPELESIVESVTALLETPDGALWIGTGAGLARWHQGRLDWFGRDAPPFLPNVRAIAWGPDGAVWAGSSRHGLGRLEDGRLEVFDPTLGLPTRAVVALHWQGPDTLWLGTLDRGLIRMRKGRFATVGVTNGLPSATVFHVADDGRGFFWCSSPAGIYRVAQSDVNACADGTLAEAHVLQFGRGEGMPTATCTGGFQPSGARTPDGNLWFPTAESLVEVNPAAARPSQLPPPVFIEEAWLDGEPAAFEFAHSDPPHRQLVVPPGRRRVQIRYAAVNFTAPDRVRFRHQLRDLETHWVEAGTRRSAFYSYLPPGRYEFRVTARNPDGVWQAEPAEVTILVLPAWWRTWWARMIFTAVFAAASFGAWRVVYGIKHRQQAERKAREEALARERARIAQDIHDDLGASLTRISMLSDLGGDEPPDPRETTRSLEQISATARDLTRAMDEIVWAVNPRHDTLESLVNYLVRYAQDFLSAAGLRCRLEVPLRLPERGLRAELRHNLFLAYKEALNNAVKHARATEVKVSLLLEEAGFRLTVADNGQGYDPAPAGQTAKTEADRFAAGNGLDNMRRRLELIGGRCEIDSQPGEGTRVGFGVRFAG